jgi:hypothetical protein
VRRLFLKKISILFIIPLSLLLIPCCEKDSSSVIDSSGNPPILVNGNFSLTVVNTDTINIGPERKPDDLLNIHGIATVKVIQNQGEPALGSVTCSIYKDLSDSPYGEGVLVDNGVSPDIVANDSLYSGYVYFQIYRVEIGSFWITITSESSSGYISNTLLLPFQVTRLNHPPVISNLTAADTLRLGALHRLTLQVDDADGQSDIFSVGYLSLKPNGTYANEGKLIPMFDDGIPDFPHGDAVANDGIYTYTSDVFLYAEVGTYRYTFYAIDRSGAYSDSIVHFMVIRP